MKMLRSAPLLAGFAAFTLASLASLPAQALSNTPNAEPPSGMPPDDGSYEDLGNYDPTTTTHPSYGITSTSSTSFQTINPLLITYEPCENKSGYDWTIKKEKQGEFGNTTFGAGYYGSFRVGSNAGRGSDPDKIWSDGTLRGYVTLFKIDNTILTVNGYAELKGTRGSYQFNVNAMGYDLYSKSGSAVLDERPSSTKKFFEASKTIWMGPLPVKVTAGASGDVGMVARIAYENGAVNFEASPKARVYGTARAAIDVLFASVGVSGELDLVKAEMPNKARLALGPSSVGWSMNSDINLTSLSGRINLFACLGDECWKQTLASWSPLFSGTYRVVHMNSCYAPITRPVCGNHVCDSGETSTNCAADCPAPPPPPPEEEDSSICRLYPWKC